MTKKLYKHSIFSIAAMTIALLISSSTAMVFAAETATITRDVAPVSTTNEANVENIGRFVVTPKSATFVPANRKGA